MDQHVKSDCSKRPVNCEHCAQRMSLDKLEVIVALKYTGHQVQEIIFFTESLQPHLLQKTRGMSFVWSNGVQIIGWLPLHLCVPKTI